MPAKAGPPSTQVGFRLEDDLLEQIDALVPRLKTAWSTPSRSDVIRAAIVEGLPKLRAIADRMGEAAPEEHKPRKGR
jgi:hypothetical protein